MFDASSCLRVMEELASRRRRKFAGDVAPRDMLLEGPKWAKALASSLSRGDYVPRPALLVRAVIGKKSRTLFRSTFLDAVVDRLVGAEFAALSEPALSEHVYSYRRGRSSMDVLAAFGRYVAEHRASVADPRARGLYVLRRDVAHYGESIPVHAESPLWAMLDARVRPHAGGEARFASLVKLLRSLLAREHVDFDGTTKTLSVGTPTGSAIQPALNNFYLTELDVALTRPGCFYARFGDDVVFASASRDEAESAKFDADQVLARLGLAWSETKSLDLWFNGAGRTHDDPAWKGTAHVDLLGATCAFSGTRRLRTDKWRELVRSCSERLLHGARILASASPEERARALCASLRRAFDVRSPVALAGLSEVLLASDRTQLAELDHLLALRIAELASKKRGVKAYRAFSPRRLRELGYVSVVRLRDAHYRRGRP